MRLVLAVWVCMGGVAIVWSALVKAVAVSIGEFWRVQVCNGSSGSLRTVAVCLGANRCGTAV